MTDSPHPSRPLTPTASPPPSRLRAWLLASRPRTLPAAAVPVLVGSALAFHDGLFRLWPALAALVASLLIQIGTNFANDLFDWLKGADTAARVGPTRVTSAGLLSPGAVRTGMVVAFGLAALSGAYLIWVGGWPILLIGLASIAAGIAYTGGPFPLGYNGLGDLFVFLFFGLIAVAGSYYVQALAVSGAALGLGVAVGALSTNILVVNNVRDVATDRAAGKRTLAVLLGREAARGEYLLLTVLAYAIPPALWWLGGIGGWPMLLPWLTLPQAIALVRAVRTQEGPILNQALAGTAQLLLAFGLLLALALTL